MYRSTKFRRSRKAARRGSVLLITLVLGVALASIVAFAVSETHNSFANAKREDNYARSLAAAEYGAELAIAEIGAGLSVSGSSEGSTVLGDFVAGNASSPSFYSNAEGSAVDQRRISGVYDGQEFRVKIRSARQVYNHPEDGAALALIENGWLSAPENFNKPFGEIKAYEFGDTYEITATAQYENMAGSRAEYRSRPVIQAIVNFGVNSKTSNLINESGLIHGENVRNFQVVSTGDLDLASSTLVSDDAFANIILKNVLAASSRENNITVTGEDHYLTTSFTESVTVGAEPEPLKLISGETNYFSSSSDNWNAGLLTFNFKKPKDSAKQSDLLARDAEPLNPYRPLTVAFSEKAVQYKSDGTEVEDANRAMTVKDTGMEYDMYLLGGKKAKTVTIAYPGEEYMGVTGRVAETFSGAARAEGEFDIVLPDFDRLRDLYINLSGVNDQQVTAPASWAQTFVGQYTNSKRISYDQDEVSVSAKLGVRKESIPLLSGNRVRPQTIQTVRNKDKQILIRLYVGKDENGKTVYYKYPIAAEYESVQEYEAIDATIGNFNPQEIINHIGKVGVAAAVADGTLIKKADGTYWHVYRGIDVTDSKGNTITVGIMLEYRVDPSNAKKGNLWYTDPATGKEMANPSNGFKNTKVRVYIPAGEPTLELASGNEWTGYYIWADAYLTALDKNNLPITGGSVKAGSGFYLNRDKEGMTYVDGALNDKLPVARLFSIQELLGYSLVKRADAEGYGQPAIIQQEDATGADKRVMFADKSNQRAASNAERVKVGFDEVYQAFADRYDSNPVKNGIHPLFPDQPSPGYVQDRNDPIRVLMIPEELFASGKVTEGDGKIVGYDGALDFSSDNPDIKVYKSMDDFLFEKEFILYAAIDEKTGRIVEETKEVVNFMTVCVMGGFEEEGELTANYDYTDLVYTVYIAPAALGDPSANVVSNTTQQWWEREESEGLTGGKSHLALSYNNSIGNGENYTSGELRSANFALLGSDVSPGTELSQRIWTMLDGEGTGYPEFPRAVFTVENDAFVLNKTNDRVAQYLDAWDELGILRSPVFYFTDSDAVQFLIYTIKNTDELLSFDIETARQLLIAHFAGGSEKYEMRHISDRYGSADDAEVLQKLLSKRLAILDDSPQSSFGINRDDLSIREVAGSLLGYRTYTVPGVKTKDYTPIQQGQSGSVEKSFIAGEAVPVLKDNQLSFGSETVPFRESAIEITGDTYPATVRQAEVARFLSLTEDTSETVKSLYAEPYNNISSLTRAKVWSQFGMKDRRSSIGYHRGGDLDSLQEFLDKKQITEGAIPLFLDHYELVALGSSGFVPYHTTTAGTALAEELQNPDDSDATPIYEYEYNYEDNPGATFVIDKPLDGAGAMVVNGNLVIQDTFAYHGILVVLGDLIIEPTLKKDQFVWSSNGWPLDSRNNPVIPNHLDRDPATGYGPDYDAENESWFYIPAGFHDPRDITAIPTDQRSFWALDKNGNKIVNADGEGEKVVPLRVNEYRGELVLQGKLLVKGKIITKTVTDSETGDQYVGTLNAYWSWSAVDGMSDLFPLGKPVLQRISWMHNDAINVDSLWNDSQDSSGAR